MADTPQPATEEKKLHYAVMGIHGTDYKLIARVRMFVGKKAIDEDLPLPKIITVEEQLHELITKRIAEIKKKVTPKASKLTVEDGQQVINKKFDIPENAEAA